MDQCLYNKEGPLKIDSWIEYIRNCILPIYINLKKLYEFGNYLRNNVTKNNDGLTLDKIDKSLLPYFISGINENGEYTQNSLAKLVKGLYGLYVEPKLMANLFKIGSDYSKLKIKYASMESMSVRNMYNLVHNLEMLFRSLGINLPPIEKITELEQFMNTIQDLENSMIQILPMYNYYSFVITSTRHVLGPMMKSYYPEIFDNDYSLQNFLGIQRLPILHADSDKSLSIYYHGNEGLADIIFKTICLSVVSQQQVINDFKIFVNNFLRQVNYTIDNIVEEESKKIIIYQDLRAYALISRYSYDKYRYVFYERNYNNILELFEDNLLNLILFLDPSYNISVDYTGGLTFVAERDSLWSIFRSQTTISPSSILSSPYYS